MENKRSSRLCTILSKYPHIHQFLDDDFIMRQFEFESGLKCHILRRLDNERSSHGTSRHLPTLEKRLAELASVGGYDRLGPLLRGASDWDQYQEALVQIDITLWLKKRNLLGEIAPELPNGSGNADILVGFLQHNLYCEVSSFQSLGKSIQSRESRIEKNKNRHKIKKIVRTSLDKTNRQLPQDYPGILALCATKSNIIGLDVREMAELLFPSRPQVTLLMLWSWEEPSGSDSDMRWEMNDPDFCFINGQAKFREVGESLLHHLGIRGEIISV